MLFVLRFKKGVVHMSIRLYGFLLHQVFEMKLTIKILLKRE